ncbi:hypothetical protein KQX54_019629 [Cotesia glomerata]|uniref:Uncharacterized protein n=1 Tax=Cotesia glomerata TaxID=32391 RepID=A0AAV7IUA6_COTGL|nr:hypothetical protein KQX54_019629 [Cotesia glomerata]
MSVTGRCLAVAIDHHFSCESMRYIGQNVAIPTNGNTRSWTTNQPDDSRVGVKETAAATSSNEHQQRQQIRSTS